MATIGQQLTQPEPGWRRYDDKDSRITYTGQYWKSSGGTGDWGGSVMHFNYSMTGQFKYETATFLFFGTKVRLIAQRDVNRTPKAEVIIDEVVHGHCNQRLPTGGSLQRQRLVYEAIDLPQGLHKVTLRNISDWGTMTLDAIDIDSDGFILAVDESIYLDQITTPGDLIRCNYNAWRQGYVGAFGALGGETLSTLITSSTTGYGDFYFRYVDTDHRGSKIFIADRTLQHSISWDRLNEAGVATHRGVLVDLANRDVHPIPMTSNTSTYEVKASSTGATSSGSTGYPWYAFNKNSVTHGGYSEWLAANRPTTKSPHWLQIDLKGKIKVNAYRIRGTNGLILPYLGAPKSWQIQGSDDAQTWITLHEVTNEAKWSQFLERTYLLPEDANYRYYRILITENQGDLSYTGLAELTLLNRDKRLENYTFHIRLLTCGVTVDDKDNEWDKYVVNESFGGRITAGSNDAWRWRGIYTIGSTASADSATYHIIRGHTTAANYSIYPSSNTGSNAGFRPVLVVTPKSLAPADRVSCLFRSGNSIIEPSGDFLKWSDITTDPVTPDTFREHGILPKDLSTISDLRGFARTHPNPAGDIGAYKIGRTQIPVDKLTVKQVKLI